VTARLIVKVVHLVNRQRGIDSTAMPLRLISNPYEQSQLTMMGEHFRDRRLLNPRMAFEGSAAFDSVQRKLLKAFALRAETGELQALACYNPSEKTSSDLTGA
jgi:hypothetical protein